MESGKRDMPARQPAVTFRSDSLSDRLRGATAVLFAHRTVQAELIATLNEVADAVSSALSVEDVLSVIVERARRITDTDKAMLVLTDEHGERLDLDTIVVRGRRSQHAQDWWQGRLEVLAGRAFEAGEPVIEPHPEEEAVLLCAPVVVRDHPIGLMCVINSAERPFSRVQIDFLEILSAFASSAIENARLAEQGRYVLLASERDRIAREMHDGVVQSLFSISLGLEVCKKQVIRDPTAVAARLEELQQHLNTSMGELRRFIYDLRPMKLAELGMVGAVEYWMREVTSGRPVRGKVVVDGVLPHLEPAQEACLYRVAKEAVSNAVRHADASEVEVRISVSDGTVVLTVTDNGRGFDVDSARAAGTSGLGLKSITDRVAHDGGILVIESQKDSGTVLSVKLPVGGTA